MLIPFGKYKNQELNQIPSHYLRWVLANVNLEKSLKSAIELTLKLKEEQSTQGSKPKQKYKTTENYIPVDWDANLYEA